MNVQKLPPTWFRAGVIAVLTFGLAAPALPDTLADTLKRAYQLSPRLDASRANLRALDEGVAQARAGRRPTIIASANAQQSASITDDLGSDVIDNTTITGQITAELTLYDGGQTRSAIEASQAVVAAGRANLKSVEQTLFLDAVTAYVDIRRDQAFVSLGRSNVEVLQQQVQAANDRFELGEVTRTDVSLAEARLAAAQSQLVSFIGQLNISNEVFEAVVGVPPRSLAPPPPLPQLPGTVTGAEAIAMQENPAMIAARFNEVAAQFNVERARGAKRLSVTADLTGSIRNQDVGSPTVGPRATTSSLQAGVTASYPLYTGGSLESAVREAQASLAEQRFNVQDTARGVKQQTATAWATLEIARAQIVANREQVRAARIAFEGVREEATLGARTTLDVLDLEQDLRDAQVELASSVRDEYVAAYSLLSAMGLLTLEKLNLGIPAYDPDLYYSKVQDGPFFTVRGRKLDALIEKLGR
ncbi:MAG: TolC family outer membrane protein [Pseudomonadota bacterium]